MTEKTSFRNGPSEIRIRKSLVSRRQIIGMATRVISNRGLEQMTGQVEQVAGGMVARTNHVIDAVIRYIPTTLQPLPIAGRRRGHRDLLFGSIDRAHRFLRRAAQGVRHCRPCVPLDLGRMAELAAAGSSRLTYDLLRRDLRIETCSCSVLGLPLSKGNKSDENAQRTEQPPTSTFRVHGSVWIYCPKSGGIVPRLYQR